MKRNRHLQSIVNKSHKSVWALFLLFACNTISADETVQKENIKNRQHTKILSIHAIYSAGNDPYKNIINKIADELSIKNTSLKFIHHSVEINEPISRDNNDQLIIAIGKEAIESANIHYSDIDKLLITSNPAIRPNKSQAILYMTQPYCRQVNLIKLLNEDWNNIGILTTESETTETKDIQHCTKTYGMDVHSFLIRSKLNFTQDVKNALTNSDVLLALPNNTIFNRHTVKNILLTSYRLGKPVIGFSKSFVSAGAIAAVHSTEQQIANSSSQIIQHYLEHNNTFKHKINYPMQFDIAINKQVFRALQISMPDLSRIKQNLIKNRSEKPGEQQ